jgi:peptidoglycan/xylan/chitin deacetylase (PgdA/CDA1 family)
MAFLKLIGYTGLSMRDLEPYLSGEKKGRVVGITFDDGFQNNVENALPILVKHGFTATCYAVSQAIGGTNSWDMTLGIAQKPLMDADDWQMWLRSGMEIGSHTRNHADLRKLDQEQARNEIIGSKEDLQQQFGCEVRHFCYPYGWFFDTHKNLVQEAGYRTATTTRRGRVSLPTDSYALNRIMIARATHLGMFAAKILTGYEDRRS